MGPFFNLTSVSINKRNVNVAMHVGEGHVNMKTEFTVICLQVEEHQRLSANYQGAWKEV